MKLLLDTHILIWAAAGKGLSPRATELIEAPDNDLLFSAASLWEVAIKSSLGRPDFNIDPAELRSELIAAGYQEIAISGQHAVAVRMLPRLHGDPFDRLLVAQAIVEGASLLTADEDLSAYPGVLRA